MVAVCKIEAVEHINQKHSGAKSVNEAKRLRQVVAASVQVVVAGLLSILWFRFSSPAVAASDNHLFSVSVNETSKLPYNASFEAAKRLGINFVSLSLPWDEVEVSKGVYRNKFPQIANLVYPESNVKLALVLTPLDTNRSRMPKDLQLRKFDDPQTIKRFNDTFDWVVAQMPAVDLACLSIGNEVDAYLGSDASKWQQYRNFFQATGDHARHIRPRLVVGTKMTFAALRDNPEARKLATLGDAVMATYYPLNNDFTVKEPTVVNTDIDVLTERFASTPLYLLEVGYPSSNLLGSSEGKQSQFVKLFFEVWKRHSNSVKLVEFTWLNDIGEREREDWGNYYHFGDTKFLEYLGSLGLRTESGRPKRAFDVLVEETRKSGWHR